MRKTAFIASLFGLSACAQTVALPEVVVDPQFRFFSSTQQIDKITDSAAIYNRASLVGALEFTTPITFKQNGYGMVASASVRGTTAQQTAVLWNGIALNSVFTGQTDFSNLTPADYESVQVRRGGGSVLYGSSAIGATVHLLTDLNHREPISHRVFARGGSFDTYEIGYKLEASGPKTSGQASLQFNHSQNDFSLPDSGRNRNGAYTNLTMNGGWRYDLGRGQQLHFYSRLFTDNRNFSLIDPNETPTRYKNLNSANQILYTLRRTKVETNFRAAIVSENYQFFDAPLDELPSEGTATTYIFRNDFTWHASQRLKIHTGAEYTRSIGRGTDVAEAARTVCALNVLARYKPFGFLTGEFGIRREFASGMQSPLLFSGGLAVNLTSKLSLRGNISRNFPLPTFNDLFWGEGGNPDLKPEDAFQMEIGPVLQTAWGTFQSTVFHLEINDMIQWLPNAGVWFPRNVREVRSKGIEFSWNLTRRIGTYRADLLLNYAFTQSEDRLTGKQLIYVPVHRTTTNLSLSRGSFTLYSQLLNQGLTHTRSDNNRRYALPPFTLMNLGSEYRISKDYRLGFQVSNVADEAYQTVEGREMPGRHYFLFCNLNL